MLSIESLIPMKNEAVVKRKFARIGFYLTNRRILIIVWPEITRNVLFRFFFIQLM